MPKTTGLTNLIRAFAFSGVLFSVGIVLVQCLHLRVNFTDSLPRGIYQEIRAEIQPGVLVAECLPPDQAAFAQERGWLNKGYCPTGTAPILKEVVAVAGDVVQVDEKFIAVNGKMLLRTATLMLDSQGRAIPAIPRGEYTLKEGEVFLIASNIPNSWDSRYTGPARVENLITTARPILTEGEQ